MIIKQRLCRRVNGEREYYLDDKEYHTLQEIKDLCYEKSQNTLISESTRFEFVLIDTDEEIEIVGSWKKDSDGFYNIVLKTIF